MFNLPSRMVCYLAFDALVWNCHLPLAKMMASIRNKAWKRTIQQARNKVKEQSEEQKVIEIQAGEVYPTQCRYRLLQMQMLSLHTSQSYFIKYRASTRCSLLLYIR